MTTLVLGTVGSIVGGIVGGPIGAQVGWLAGSLLGNLIDPPKIEGPRRSDLKLQVSEYGKPLPFVWGTGRIAGIVIDQTDLQEHKETSGGKGGPEITTYTYSASFLIALAASKTFGERAIRGVKRIWADGRLVWSDTNGEPMPCTLYLGTEDQEPDPTFEAIHGVGEQPAYRGLAYASFADLMLTDYGDRIPLWEFEVYTGVGSFPYRVSTFNLAPDGLGIDSVTYDAGRVTVGSYNAIQYYERTFTLAGVEDTSAAYAAALDPPGSVIFPVANLLAAANWVGWYVRETLTVAYTANPLGSPITAAVSGDAMYKSGAIYAMGNAGGHVGVSKWPATDGVISTETATATETYDFGNCLNQVSLFVIGTSNNDFVYVVDYYHSPLTLNEFDLDLNLTRTWDITAEDAIQGIINGSCFTVFEDEEQNLVLACDRGNPGSKQMFCFYLNSDLTLTQVAGINTDPAGGPAMGPVIELGTTGYVTVADGIACVVPPAAPVPLYQIVDDLSDMTQVGSYDTAELTDLVRWFSVGNQMIVRNAIETLRKGFMFDAVESDDQVKFRKRGASDSVVTIPDDDLVAHHEGEEPGAPLQTTRRREQGMPRNVTLRYIDVDMDYQTGAQNSPRLTTRSDSDVTIDLSIGFTADEAKQKAWQLQLSEWIERETFAWQYTRAHAEYEPCDVETVRGRVIRITNRTDTPQGVIRLEGVQHRPSLYTQEQTGAPSEGWTPQEPPGAKVATATLLLDLPLLAGTDYPNGHYAALYPETVGSWGGASLYKSVDGGTTYTAIAEALAAATVGTVAAAAGNFTGGNVFDELNVLQVTLADADSELASATETAVLNGANLCALGSVSSGWEVLQFRTATLVSPGVYNLSGLLRGRFGTEWAISAHGTNEYFVLLSTVINVNAPFAELGLARSYKGVTFGKSLASATAQSWTHNGVALRPFAPVMPGGGRDASSNLTLTWTPRRRGAGGWLDGTELPATESPEQYRVRIYTTSGYATVARTITASSASASYTAAEQTTDFGSPPATVYWDVAQLGSAGYGTAARGST